MNSVLIATDFVAALFIVVIVIGLYVIKSAEKIMYSDKENYYRETGKDWRR